MLLSLVVIPVDTAGSVSGQDGPAQKGPKGTTWDLDQFEDRAIAKLVEKSLKAADTEGSRWLKELTATYPGRIDAPTTEDILGKWFDLLAGDGKEWRREASPNRQIAELFDRVVQRLELGPVPSIRRDEFLQYAKRSLMPKPSQKQDEQAQQTPEADRVFRVLDRDASGVLERSEWTERIRTNARHADADGNRRIDMTEYRTFFDQQVSEAVDKAMRTAAARNPEPSKTAKSGLPAWFADLDDDKDGQVGLYEWRAHARPIADFMAMDLDGDGLLTPDEYRRYAKLSDPKPDTNDRTPSGPRTASDQQMIGTNRKP